MCRIECEWRLLMAVAQQKGTYFFLFFCLRHNEKKLIKFLKIKEIALNQSEFFFRIWLSSLEGIFSRIYRSWCTFFNSYHKSRMPTSHSKKKTKIPPLKYANETATDKTGSRHRSCQNFRNTPVTSPFHKGPSCENSRRDIRPNVMHPDGHKFLRLAGHICQDARMSL